MKFVSTKNQAEFYPEEDVTRRTEDGREIVVARKGTPIPMNKAIQFGLVKKSEEKPEKASDEKGTKPAEDKAKKGGSENKSKGGDE